MAEAELLACTPNGYSQAARIPAASTLVWISGQTPVDVDGRIPTGWEAQTRLAMQNVGAALKLGGANWTDVFKFTFFVVDTAEVATIRAIRDEFVDTQRPPTSTLVRVAGLVRPELLIEIEAVAAVR